MKLNVNNQEYSFREIVIEFNFSIYSDVYSSKNNKTLTHRRYSKFKIIIENKYSNFLDIGLGTYLAKLKEAGDLFYKEFLNKNGDKIYSTFYITDKLAQNSKGIYINCIDNEINYIGRCRDTFGKRINQGYGKIYPKNCYIDGQSTNCHLNNLVTENMGKAKLYILDLHDEKQIIELEEALIKKYQPEWNVSLKASKEMLPIINILNNEYYLKLCPIEEVRCLYWECLDQCSNLYNSYMTASR
ncbi:hypothetical protein E0485_05510 [Paenibacillus albiflavus]|uniref:GIY-YIG domain-containing protein n=1 Tax=Paenibacillus albiflavus TaxID=2545760 RepID=A0A4V6P6D9_9BACL|nr:hypothetical protein [Paenibacillus albiflavus]TCZ79322.1 hypothetical protein E0485_05510 [Paenibacillus albiflavus]